MNHKTISILALGDSYTIGEDVPEKDRWVVQLAEDLKDKNGIAIDKIEIIAKTGWTSGELISAIQERKIQGKWDLVFLLIGVNNQYRGYSLEQYEQEFKKLLLMAIQFATDPASVYVLSIPDWGNTPFAKGKDKVKIAGQIDQFNKVNATLATSSGVQYINITPISRITPLPSHLLAKDGLHPSGAMYKLWKDEVFVKIRNF
jgi:lysophospholipase L1-like esterase